MMDFIGVIEQIRKNNAAVDRSLLISV